ncbi:MAG: Flp family type IVb pilin [Alphaproteobacteria bacterium]
MWYLKLRTFIMSLLKDESGANAVEYALIMALVAVFIIAAVILMATEIGNLFNAMAACLSDAVNCSATTF